MPIQVSTSVCIDLEMFLESRCNNGRVGRSLQSDSLSQHLTKRYLVVPGKGRVGGSLQSARFTLPMSYKEPISQAYMYIMHRSVVH